MQNVVRADVLRFGIPAVLLVTSAAAVSVWDFTRNEPPALTWSPPTIAAAGMILTALVINLTAAVTLGRFYSSTLVIREDHRVIRSGIYKHIRHPIYLGTTLAMMAIPVCLGSLYGALLMSLLVPIFLGRIKMEESMLIEEFGEEYRAYMEATHKLIPFLY